jgi:hypothetical protein
LIPPQKNPAHAGFFLLYNISRHSGTEFPETEHNDNQLHARHDRTADCNINLGLDGGGRITAQGPPKQIAANPASVTGPYLKNVLGKK